MCWTRDHECQPAMGSCPLEKVTAPSPSAQSFPSLISVLPSPPPAQHPLLSSIPEEPVGAQHGTGAIAPIPSPLQSHSTTAPRHWAGEGCRVKASPRRWQSTAAPASKTEESPIHVQCKGRTSGFFFLPDTCNNTIHESADLAQESSRAPVTEASGQAHGTDFAYHDRR